MSEQQQRVRELQRKMTIVFSVLFIIIGFVMLVVTAQRSGGIGYLIGALFVGLGGGRLKMALNSRPGRGADGDDGS